MGSPPTPTPPTASSSTAIAPAAPTSPSDAQRLLVEKAAGQIYMAVEEDQKIHFNGIDDDPVKMWLKLGAVHHSKRPGTRFNAYDDFFSGRRVMSLYRLSLGELMKE
jgi:hypothetical protein